MTVRHEPTRFDDEADLVLAARGGDQGAFTTLFRRWLDPCTDVARRIVHEEQAAADVAQETFLVAWKQLDTLRDPSAFGGWVLRTARNKALNRLERERRSRPADHADPALAHLRADDDIEGGVVEDLNAEEHRDLVRAATAVLGEREVSVLDLHLRHGMGAPELGEELGVTPNNAHQLLFRMRQRLGAGIRAWTLWDHGKPKCAGLASALGTADITGFGRPAVKAIDRHVGTCEACNTRQVALVAPGALFASAPVVGLAPALRQPVVDALRDAGVPLGSDAAVPGSQPPGTQPRTTQSPTAQRSGTPPSEDRHVGGGGDPEHLEDVPDGADGESRTRRRAVAVAAVLLVLLAGLGTWAVLEDDGTDVTATGGPDTTEVTEQASPAAAPARGDEPSTSVEAVAGPGPGDPAGAAPRSGSTSTTAPGLPFSDEPGSGASPSVPGAPPLVHPEPDPAAEDPSVVPPPSPDPNSPPPSPPPTFATTTPTLAAAPPQVLSFAAKAAGSPGCFQMSWSTIGATTVTITAVSPHVLLTKLTSLPTSGGAAACVGPVAVPPGALRLWATGPGGTASAGAP